MVFRETQQKFAAKYIFKSNRVNQQKMVTPFNDVC